MRVSRATFLRCGSPSVLFLLLSHWSMFTRAMAMLPHETTTMISNSLRAALPGLLDDTKLTPIAFEESSVASKKQVVLQSDQSKSLRDIAKEQAQLGSDYRGSLCFVVRRPGCVLCREHGQQLTEAALQSDVLKEYALWGIVKETGVDDEGLVEFHESFFNFPLFRDSEQAVYKAFGSRRIGLSTWNPLKLYRGYKELGKRLKEKEIAGNLKGEGLIQGGLLLFDREGNLKYSYDEQVGTEFEMDKIIDAVKLASAETMAPPEAATQEL